MLGFFYKYSIRIILKDPNMNNLNKVDAPRLIMRGFVEINDITDSEPKNLLSDYNDINPENMSYSIAQALCNETGTAGFSLGAIHEMRFGNGGTTIIAAEDRINYKKPRIGTLSALYSQKYAKHINNNLDNTVDPNYNSVRAVHIPGQIFSDIVVTCTLELSEPNGQNTSDNGVAAGVTGEKGDFVFDELGLYDYSGKHLTHIIFHPIQKSANRILQVKYTIRVQLV